MGKNKVEPPKIWGSGGGGDIGVAGGLIMDSHSRIVSGTNRNIGIRFLFGSRQEGFGLAKPQFRIVSLVDSRSYSENGTNRSHALVPAAGTATMFGD